MQEKLSVINTADVDIHIYIKITFSHGSVNPYGSGTSA